MLQFKFVFGLNNFKLVYSLLFHIPLSKVYCQDLGQRKKLCTTFSSCMLSRNLVGLMMQKIDLPFIHMQVIFPFVWFVMLIVCKQNNSHSQQCSAIIAIIFMPNYRCFNILIPFLVPW